MTIADPLRPPDRWLPISIAPNDADLEVAVLDRAGIHALVLPVLRHKFGWVDAVSGELVDVEPTHWRPWSEIH